MRPEPYNVASEHSQYAPDEWVSVSCAGMHRRVRGLIVGLLGVRRTGPHEFAVYDPTKFKDNTVPIANMWMVERVNSPYCIYILHRYDNALLFADEVNRFSQCQGEFPLDLNGDDKVRAALGERMIQWCARHVSVADSNDQPAMSYRLWLERMDRR